MKIIIYDLLDVLETYNDKLVIKFLKKKRLDDILVGYTIDSMDEYCLMLQAIKFQSAAFVKFLLDNEYQVNEVDTFNRGTKSYLELYGTEEILELLKNERIDDSAYDFKHEKILLEEMKNKKMIAKTEDDLIKAHEATSENAYKLFVNQECVCVYCKNRFPSNRIVDLCINGGLSALCPHCGIDAVIGEISGYDLSDLFIEAMHEFFFNNQNSKISNHIRYKVLKYGKYFR